MCDDLEKRYAKYAKTMQDAGITPHSFDAWNRVQKSAPLEQQVIDASYREYRKWLYARSVSETRTPRRIVTFEQWLTAKNIIARGNHVTVAYKVHDEICTETFTEQAQFEARNAFIRTYPTWMLLGLSSRKIAQLLNLEIQRNAADADKREAVARREK